MILVEETIKFVCICLCLFYWNAYEKNGHSCVFKAIAKRTFTVNLYIWMTLSLNLLLMAFTVLFVTLKN